MVSEQSNVEKGKSFQNTVAHILRNYYGIPFVHEVAIEIGHPPKPHKFDLVSTDYKIVVECKSYSWTSAGKNPSAKLTTLNEAAFYFTFLRDRKCVLAIRRDAHPTTGKSLAEYYCQHYRHLLSGIDVLSQ